MWISYWNIKMVSSSISIIIMDITSSMVRVANLKKSRNMSIVFLRMMLRRMMDWM